MRRRSGVLYRRSRERERDLVLCLLLFFFFRGACLSGLSLLSLGRPFDCGLVVMVRSAFPKGFSLDCTLDCVGFLFFWVFFLRCCIPCVWVDFTPPILGGGFSGGSARVVPVRIREATRLFPTGSRELSGARLDSSACTRLDTSAIVGRPSGRVSHSYLTSARHAR